MILEEEKESEPFLPVATQDENKKLLKNQMYLKVKDIQDFHDNN